jgi:hypothetical protein
MMIHPIILVSNDVTSYSWFLIIIIWVSYLPKLHVASHPMLSCLTLCSLVLLFSLDFPYDRYSFLFSCFMRDEQNQRHFSLHVPEMMWFMLYNNLLAKSLFPNLFLVFFLLFCCCSITRIRNVENDQTKITWPSSSSRFLFSLLLSFFLRK